MAFTATLILCLSTALVGVAPVNAIASTNTTAVVQQNKADTSFGPTDIPGVISGAGDIYQKILDCKANQKDGKPCLDSREETQFGIIREQLAQMMAQMQANHKQEMDALQAVYNEEKKIDITQQYTTVTQMAPSVNIAMLKYDEYLGCLDSWAKNQTSCQLTDVNGYNPQTYTFTTIDGMYAPGGPVDRLNQATLIHWAPGQKDPQVVEEMLLTAGTNLQSAMAGDGHKPGLYEAYLDYYLALENTADGGQKVDGIPPYVSMSTTQAMNNSVNYLTQLQAMYFTATSAAIDNAVNGPPQAGKPRNPGPAKDIIERGISGEQNMEFLGITNQQTNWLFPTTDSILAGQPGHTPAATAESSKMRGGVPAPSAGNVTAADQGFFTTDSGNVYLLTNWYGTTDPWAAYSGSPRTTSHYPAKSQLDDISATLVAHNYPYSSIQKAHTWALSPNEMWSVFPTVKAARIEQVLPCPMGTDGCTQETWTHKNWWLPVTVYTGYDESDVPGSPGADPYDPRDTGQCIAPVKMFDGNLNTQNEDKRPSLNAVADTLNTSGRGWSTPVDPGNQILSFSTGGHGINGNASYNAWQPKNSAAIPAYDIFYNPDVYGRYRPMGLGWALRCGGHTASLERAEQPWINTRVTPYETEDIQINTQGDHGKLSDAPIWKMVNNKMKTQQ